MKYTKLAGITLLSIGLGSFEAYAQLAKVSPPILSTTNPQTIPGPLTLGVVVANSLKNGGQPVTNQTGNYPIVQSDCGTKITDYGATGTHTYTMSSGLGLGCRVVFVQETTFKITVTNAAGEIINYLTADGTSVTGSATAGVTVVNSLGQYGSIVVGQETATIATITTGAQ